jgi:hypothetical protein
VEGNMQKMHIVFSDKPSFSSASYLQNDEFRKITPRRCDTRYEEPGRFIGCWLTASVQYQADEAIRGAQARVVDYLGLVNELKQVLATYTESGTRETASIKSRQWRSVEKCEICCGLLYSFDRSKWNRVSRETAWRSCPAGRNISGVEDSNACGSLRTDSKPALRSFKILSDGGVPSHQQPGEPITAACARAIDGAQY